VAGVNHHGDTAGEEGGTLPQGYATLREGPKDLSSGVFVVLDELLAHNSNSAAT
jgi:hypothetical protein